MERPDQFKLLSVSEALRTGTKFLYPLEFYSIFYALIAGVISDTGGFDLANGFNPEVLKAARQGKCVILFSDATEGRTYDYASDNGVIYVFDFLQQFITSNDLPAQNVWFVSGNPLGYVDFESWKLARNIKSEHCFNFVAENISPFHLRCIYESRRRGQDINIRPTDRISATSFHRFKVDPSEAPQDQPTAGQVGLREKEFINLNSNIRPHRQLFVTLLKSLGMLERGFISLRKVEANQETRLLMRQFGLDDAWLQLERDLPLNVDLDNHRIDNNFQTFYPRNSLFHKKSYINFVSETWFFELQGQRHTHCTEKVIQPVITFQPFLIVGRSNALATMRKAGYWTFSDFWDESYDQYINNAERFEKLMVTVSGISKMSRSDIHSIYIECLPILKHNFSVFLNAPLEWDRIFSQINQTLSK